MKPSQKFINQCNKYMYSFFNYLPTKYRNVSDYDWKVRKFIWGFKDGKFSDYAAKLVAEKLIEKYGQKVSNIVFACIPASSKEKNIIRYKRFAEEVCRISGAQNAYNAISVEGQRLAIHESNNVKHVQNTEVITFDKSFFANKEVVVFDDIITQGRSYVNFANHLESFGAIVIGGLFLAKTINF